MPSDTTAAVDKSTTNKEEFATPIATNNGSTIVAYAGDKPVYDAGWRSFPGAVYYIIGNEFCERYSFYGMKAILPMYLKTALKLTEDRATTFIHTFNFSAYAFTLLGGVVSDSWLGKFKTILSLSIVYCLGSLVLALTSFPGFGVWGCLLGLGLLALGTGGIKPCVSSFGGDQFHPAQALTMALFFSFFYFIINAGSTLSMLITPILRADVHCLGQKSCYPLAFGVPALLMFIATAVFVLGYRMYRHVPPEGNVAVRVCRAVGLALKRKVTKKYPSTPVGHWIELAQPEYSPSFLDDTRKFLAVIHVFAPICLFWALYDQQGSRWTYQALMMDPNVNLFGWRFAIKPDQMGLINAVLILVMIPFFDRCVYPLLRVIGFPLRPLTRMLWGMILAALSFVVAALIQFAMVSRGTFMPSPDDPSTMTCVDGCVHVLAQVPQYILITAGEILFSITGLEFTYSQAPPAMKTCGQAAWLMTVALGNLVVIVLNETDPVKRLLGSNRNLHSWNFVFWTGVITVAIVVFWLLSRSYKYVEDGYYAVPANSTNPSTTKLPAMEGRVSDDSD